ncbi:Major facilitator superfamily domain-containing 7 [Lecanosticta acicola]|uniref:Major facilitator superfamily domain-containing 7 n=1 Tax=Lecanosticta acicola TaxID=111012 RepID=A0AAI8YTU1_9PEZI|nr:Major facilitator superfamily domain-containing 7 [Lecanosticta acicola]
MHNGRDPSGHHEIPGQLKDAPTKHSSLRSCCAATIISLQIRIATMALDLSSNHREPEETRSQAIDRSDFDNSEQSNLSRETTPHDDGEYNNYRYNNLPDIESEGLVKERKYRLYKRRWFGLAELTLLNFAVGRGYAAPGVVSSTATAWYGISFAESNYLSVASSLVFIVPAPFTIWILNRWGPKFSIIVACIFTVIGNWIIYGGARAHNFPVNIFGTIVHSLALPFILAMPTRYSRQWFGDRGRTLATALPSLAYALGSGVGALSGPYMVKPLGPFNYDEQALIIAIVFTVAAIPAPFLPRAPPHPPSAVADVRRLGGLESMKLLLRNPTFYVQFISFAVFAGAIDAVITISNQAIHPYGYPQQDAGYAIAALVFVGIATAMVISPILDRTQAHLIALKVIVIFTAAAYTALPFIPQTRSVAGLYIIFALIGAGSLSIEPCVLEFQAAWTHPVSPEFSSVIGWCGAKVIGAIFIIVAGDSLALKKPQEGQPVGSLFNGLIFIAAMCWVCVPLSLMTGTIIKRPAASVVEGND